MQKDQCFELGYVERPFGYEGALIAHFDVDNPAYYLKMKTIFLEINGQLIPYTAEKMALHKGNQVMVRLANVTDEEAAKKMKGTRLFLPESCLPSLDKGYYFHELVNCRVIDEVSGPLGTVKEIIDLPNHTLASVDFEGNEVLFPVHDQILLRFDRNKKEIYTRLPEGLLEIYLTPQTEEDHAD